MWDRSQRPAPVPVAPRSPPDAASQLGIRPVRLAQAFREGRVATEGGRGGEVVAGGEVGRSGGRDSRGRDRRLA